MASGGAFHTGCFTCYCCNKSLEVTTVYENQGEIYCKSKLNYDRNRRIKVNVLF